MKNVQGVKRLHGMVAGIIAAFIAWPVNAYLSRLGGRWSLVFWVPLLEESLKTGAAWLLNGDLILAHLVFGSIEGIYEQLRDRQLGAAMMAFGGHLGFGVITGLLSEIFSIIGLAVLGAALVHAVWNWGVLRFLTKGSI